MTMTMRDKKDTRNTLPVVLEVLKEANRPMGVNEIMELAGKRLPTQSQTPRNVVCRDLAMDIKRRGEHSRVVRVREGVYAARA